MAAHLAVIPPGLFCGGRQAVEATGATPGVVFGPGVYFLLKAGRLVYIGQSKNVAQRMLGHRAKRADEVWTLQVEPSHLLLAESNFIALLLPALNKRVDHYPFEWLFARRVEMGIATSFEEASLKLPGSFVIGDAPQVFGSELGRNRFLPVDRITTRNTAQRYLNEIRDLAARRGAR